MHGTNEFARAEPASRKRSSQDSSLVTRQVVEAFSPSASTTTSAPASTARIAPATAEVKAAASVSAAPINPSVRVRCFLGSLDFFPVQYVVGEKFRGIGEHVGGDRGTPTRQAGQLIHVATVALVS